MKITPQVIIDKEFRVKFRGFDMAEVDTFLEEVAQSFSKLVEENDHLREEVTALEEKIQSGGGVAAQGQVKFPVELKNFLKELKQDTTIINKEIASLKQDRSAFDALEKSLKESVASLQSFAETPSERQETVLPADLQPVLQDFTKTAETLNAELAGLKEDRQSFDLLKKNIDQTLAEIKKAGPASAPQGAAEGGDLAAELAAIKQEVASIQQYQENIKKDLQGMLKSHFDDLAAQLSAAPAGPPLPKKTKGAKADETLKAAIIEEEPEGQPEEKPGFDMAAFTPADDDELEFLSEDDILDVDKLRGVFQSVLDDSVSDAPTSREDEEETAADLLFFDDDLLEVMNEPEPEVTFSLDEKGGGNKSAKGKI